MRPHLSPLPTLLCSAALLLAGTAPALAGAHDGAGGKPKTPPTPEAFYEHTGFEGREQVLTDAVVKAVREAKPNNGETLNFNADQQRMLGLAVAKAIKTISNDTPYQHEMNDALVKAHLTNIQFAKDNGMLKEMIDHEVKTQTFMIQRVGKMIRDGGSPELATIALTERTACFYQLVQEYQRTGTTMRWKAPYGNVLKVTPPDRPAQPHGTGDPRGLHGAPHEETGRDHGHGPGNHALAGRRLGQHDDQGAREGRRQIVA